MIKCTYDEDIFTLDAAKRRQLPAWIREGLEKMEKEKQKAVERERQEILRKQELEARKQAEDEARAVLNPCKSKFVGVQMHALIACFANKPMLNNLEKHSLFFISRYSFEMQDSDSEKEIEQDLDDGVHNQQVTEKNFERTPDILLRPRKSRFRDADSPDPHTHADRSPTTSNATIPTPKRTREEILQDVVNIIPIKFIVNRRFYDITDLLRYRC